MSLSLQQFRYLGIIAVFIAGIIGATGAQAYTPDDTKWNQQYGPQTIKAPYGWDLTLGSTTVKICFIDSGVFYDHEDLQGARYLGGWDFYNNDSDPQDDFGHGTRTAGVAVATINNGKGIAGLAQVGFYAVKVNGENGALNHPSVDDAIRWCFDPNHKADIISFGICTPTLYPEWQSAVEDAWSAGLLLLAPAGNNNGGSCVDGIGYPALFQQVIAVTCITSARAFCDFSNQGDEAAIAAPGASILSTSITCTGSGATRVCNPTYASDSGTSYSTPHVAGTAALVKAFAPSLTNQQIRDRLNASKDPFAPGACPPGKNCGLGIVDAHGAVVGEPGKTSLRGSVWDEATGYPLVAVTVQITKVGTPETYSASTAADGFYKFVTVLSTGTWRVEFSHATCGMDAYNVNFDNEPQTVNQFLNCGGPPPTGPQPEP